jgi:hypothetical protein
MTHLIHVAPLVNFSQGAVADLCLALGSGINW